MSTSPRDDEAGNDGSPGQTLSSKAVYGGFCGALLLGGLVAALGSLGSGLGDGLRWFLYMIAAAVITIILGIIFGVPRARAEFVAGASERYASNSNLEQISDWLTKLLVGAGLVELSRAPSLAASLGDYLGAGMTVPNSAAYSLAAVVYGAGLGFTTGYIWTRLRLRVYLEASDRLAADASRARNLANNLRRQNEAFAQVESGRDLNRAAENAVQARKAVGLGSIAPILWVDDTPQNNIALVDALRSLDIEVELADSTSEAIDAFNRRTYGLIISDLGRKEGESYIEDAGLDLIKAIRTKDPTVPIFIFGTHRAVARRDELLREGATEVTNRASELLEKATSAVTRPRP